MMKLVSSWSHYLYFQCDTCGEAVHVDATLDFPSEATCRSGKCRPPTQDRDAVADGGHFARTKHDEHARPMTVSPLRAGLRLRPWSQTLRDNGNFRNDEPHRQKFHKPIT